MGLRAVPSRPGVGTGPPIGPGGALSIRIGGIVGGGIALIRVTFFNRHALSATGSAGSIAVFAIVNVANARIADRTGSRRVIPVAGAVACGAALLALVAGLCARPDAAQEVAFLVALLVIPFA